VPTSSTFAFADEVVVHGRHRTPLHASKDPHGATTVVPREELEAPGLRASDVLRRQPGIAIVDTGGYGSLSTASVRGATSAQTPVYLAGIRLNDDVAGTADLSLVPLWMIERIEIYRGHAPLEADRLGVAGAIFFEPRRPKQSEGAAGGMLGSFGAEGYFARAQVGDERAGALVGVRYERARNDYKFLDDRGTRFVTDDDRISQRTNADAATWDAWSLGTVRLGSRGRLDIVGNVVSRTQGVPGLALLPTRSARARFDRELLGVSTSLPCGPRCEWRAFAHALVAKSRIDDPEFELGLGAAGTTVRGARAESGSEVHLKLGPKVTLAPSVRLSAESLTLAPLAQSSAVADRLFVRPGAQLEIAVTDKTALRFVGALEHQATSGPLRMPGTLDAPPTGPTSTQPMLRASASHNLSQDVELSASAGRYGRVPTLGELYGISGAARGNPGLRTENGYVFDLGGKGLLPLGKTGVVYGQAFGFARFVDDLIAFRRASLSYLRAFNVGESRTLGVETQIGVSPWSFLLVEAHATFLDARDVSPQSGSAPLPFRSRLVLAPRVELRSGRVPALRLDRARLEVRYVYQSNRTADPAGLIRIPEQGSLDVEGELTHFGGAWSIRAFAQNVMGQARYDLVGYPLPGRAFFVSAEWRAK
jgi:iron complex outermembrane receptor protein